MLEISLSTGELEFYSRQIRLEQVGVVGQSKLKKASVLIVGLGGLGSPLALYLAAAGIGKLGIIEFDRVERSNLHRQILYGESQVGSSKLEKAEERLRDLNPNIEIEAYPWPMAASNARAIVSKYDLVADGADNFTTRYVVNDACVLEKKPLVSASVLEFEGQLSVFGYQGGPCYRCLFPQAPPEGASPSCAEGGVLGVLPGVMGTLQATEILKIILGIGEILSGKLLNYEGLSCGFNILNFSRSISCAVCGDKPSITEVLDSLDSTVNCVNQHKIKEISPEELALELNSDREGKNTNLFLLDVRENHERAESSIQPSLHAPLASVLENELVLPKNKTIVIYCKLGGRSRIASEFLQTKGYVVKSLFGGIEAWLRFIRR